MVVLGQDPDVVSKPWTEFDDDQGSYSYHTSGISNVLFYFFYHRHTAFGRAAPSPRERGTLATNARRLLGIYPEFEIRRAIDRFYLTPTSRKHPYPAMAFCNRNFQDRLFRGVTVEPQADVLRYIANAFVRTPDMEIAWPEEQDHDLLVEFTTDPMLNVLVRTYPDVVAAILVEWGVSEDSMRMMTVACDHYEWLLGFVPDPPESFEELRSNLPLPKDFVTKIRLRDTQQLLSEAVRIAVVRG